MGAEHTTVDPVQFADDDCKPRDLVVDAVLRRKQSSRRLEAVEALPLPEPSQLPSHYLGVAMLASTSGPQPGRAL